MHKPVRIPFSDLRPGAWRNLALAAVIALYLGQIGSAWLTHALFQPGGLDYLGFWSTGRAATVSNYAHAYDLQLLDDLQVQQLANYGISVHGYFPVPAPLFAVFIVPFQLLSFLDSKSSFWLWSVSNLVALISYSLYFIHRVAEPGTPRSRSVRVLAFVLLSYPVYQNFFWGQTEVFLLICCGEFIRNALAHRPVASGLWLGGLLAKPQVLILVLPALLLLKNWRLLWGFCASAMSILLSSLALSGGDGLRAMLRLWFSYLPGIATNAPQAMSNWRMLGIHLGAWLSPILGWTAVGLGMLASLAIWYLLCRDHPPFGSTKWVIMMGGIFSISCAFTWHSHIHLMMVIIPFLVFAAMKRVIPDSIYEVWSLAMPAAEVVILVAAVLINLAGIPQGAFGALLLGLTGLSLNVWVALVMLRHGRALPGAAETPISGPARRDLQHA